MGSKGGRFPRLPQASMYAHTVGFQSCLEQEVLVLGVVFARGGVKAGTDEEW